MLEDHPMSDAKGRKKSADVLRWDIPAGDDGLRKDAILLAVLKGKEMVSVSLHMAERPDEPLGNWCQ